MFRPISVLLIILMMAGCTEPGEKTDAGTANGSGPITFATGRDTTAYLQPLLDRWNRAHPAEPVTLLELPEAADEQRAQLVANLQAKSDRYDVLGLDVTMTAEFADSGWIIPLERADFPLEEFLPPVVETAVYQGRLWAVPYTSNAGLLYYRTDLVKRPPKSWAELRRQARRITRETDIQGYAGQFLAYEGLTVNFAEAVQAAGGRLFDRDGARTTAETGPLETAIARLQRGLREGWIPAEALRYKEEEARLAFQRGRLAFARNWPPAYGPATAPGSAVRGRFAVTRLPGPSVLGGNNLAISAYSRHPHTAQRFIHYFTSLDVQRRVLTDGSFPPVWAELYDDPGLIDRFPYLPVLKESILTAGRRPASADYNQLSLVIAGNVAKALASPSTESPAEIATALTVELAEVRRTQ